MTPSLNMNEHLDAISLKLRFLSKIKILGDCWVWHGAKNGVGYGAIRVKRIKRPAHRVSYELFKGKIPDGMFVCHSCDNPPCVNPNHLWTGTHRDNMQDAIRKGRNRPPVPRKQDGELNNAHKLTKEQVREIRNLKNRFSYSGMKLSKMFNISKSQMYRILSNEHWNSLSQ